MSIGENKGLTIEELREQWNKVCFMSGLGYSWQAWLKCAKANNILREG